MASIEIENASVSYFLRGGGRKKNLDRGAVGAQIIVRQSYLEIPALKDVTVSIKNGERVGLIGVNGSGKSTLLKLCAGALATKSGTIRIDGRVSPQFSLGAGVKSTLSGRRNAELKALYMGTPQRSIDERVEQIRELSGLGGYFELPMSTYSAGMRSRLVMSLMMLVRPDILVMDEWIGAADPTVNKTVGVLQANLINAASILVLASHSQQVLTEWTNQVIWMDQGQIRARGPTKEVFSQYQKWQEDQRN